MLVTAEGITIWSCFPKASHPVEKVEAEGGYCTINKGAWAKCYYRATKGDGSLGK